MTTEYIGETIQVGSSQLCIPSSICTDSTIFNHIFSIQTWNTVMTPDQKERIMKLLPPELGSNPDTALTTIESLLTGTLTRFGISPLQSFFHELQNGSYDPEVARGKVKIQRLRRREALEKKRQYHTKFLQQIIISSQACLQKLTSFSKRTPIKPKPKAKVQKQETAPKPLSTSKKKLSPLRQKVAKRLKNEIQAMNQAFPSIGPLSSSSVEDATAPKKRKRNPIDSTIKLPPYKNRLIGSTPPLPNSISMPKFPPSLIGLTSHLNHDIKPLPSTPPLISPQLMQKHVLKASPILASQLQAPIQSLPPDKQLPVPLPPPPMRSSVNHFIPPELPGLPHALPGLLKEEESSSDEDEFEAIEPTIGFYSTVLPSSNNKPPIKTFNSKASSYQPPRQVQTLPLSKVDLPKNKPTKVATVTPLIKVEPLNSVPKPIVTITTGMTMTSNTPKFIPKPLPSFTLRTSSAGSRVLQNHKLPNTLSMAQNQLLSVRPTTPIYRGMHGGSVSTYGDGAMVNGTAIHTPSSGRSTFVPPMPLTLSDLSLSLNLGLDVTKMEDKIDDLPVLDGSAFDSIPNLTDDLDVFDLDLVDGLCDFEVMLSEEKQYSSFFGLIREVLCSTQNHRMTYSCLEKTVQKWAANGSAELNPWFHRIHGWSEALITGLNFLAGNYQEIHPEDFVPYLEYKYKTKYYQWIGAGRDSDGNLLTLCNIWLDNLDKLPPVKKQDGDNEEQEEEEDENEDSDEHMEEVKKKYLRPKTPPPPRFLTEWTVRPSTIEEKEEFQGQEKVRFDNPHKAFTYRMHNYESVVGPVKGVYSNQTGVTNKARGHSLLVDDRPPYVTILALVRDSVARLPNGEGTRSEICEMLRDSNFLAPEASNVTLNSVVSGALDRLHYERDPCVRYDSHKKNWIYLHRDRSQEQFERLHHNRSYTKSTKSRNNGGRKSRKKTLSQTSSNEGVTTAQPSSSSSSVVSTPATTPKVTSPPTFSTNIDTATATAKPGLVASSFATATARATPSPVIQFAIPMSSNSGVMTTKSWVASEPPPSAVLGEIGSSNLPSLTDGVTGKQHMSTPSATTVLGTTAVMSPKPPMDIKVEPALGASTCSAAQLQQSGFIFNNIFRLPNLKLPGNVRFMRVQSSPAAGGAGVTATSGQVQLNALRLPQQRIILRPAGFPGYVPGQGLIFGQTPSGQTVIISAIGSPQVLSTQPSTTPTQSTDQLTTIPPSAVLRISPTDIGMTAANTSSTSTFIGSSAVTLKPTLAPISHLQSNHMVSTPTPLVTRSPTVPTQRPVGNCAKLPLNSVGRTQFGNMNTIVRGPMSTMSTHSVVPGTNTRFPNAPSPVVIRTNVDFQTPRLAIGKGPGPLQSIKMIPVTSNNQMLARLLSPGPITTLSKPGMPPAASTTTNSQALL